MDPFATADDIAAVWRPLTDAEKVVADGLLAEASMKLRARVPNLDTRAAVDEVARALAKIAVVNAAKRVLQNPDAARQITETAGPFSHNVTVDTALSSGLLYIADDDLVGLVPANGYALGTARLKAGLA